MKVPITALAVQGAACQRNARTAVKALENAAAGFRKEKFSIGQFNPKIYALRDIEEGRVQARLAKLPIRPE